MGSLSKTGDKTITVMLVDDHPVVRDGYRRLLESTPDIRVVGEAGDGDAALSQYQKLWPDVMVLDLSMPGSGGLEVISRLITKEPMARILVFSMHESITMISRAIDAGALGYLTKQSGMGQMIDAVRQVARRQIYIDPAYVQEVLQLRQHDGDPLDTLTKREFQIFSLLAEGRSSAEIADALSISHGTVGVHHANIMKKLDLNNSAQLVRLAIRYGVIQP
jgi:two-component system invasion response regulator UvrY